MAIEGILEFTTEEADVLALAWYEAWLMRIPVYLNSHSGGK